MLNEERIILMTRLASYESGEGKRCSATGSYFRSDYVGMQVLKSIVCASVAFAICFGLYVLYDFENFMLEIYRMDLFAFAKQVLIYYAVTVAGYTLLTYGVYSYRYSKAKKSLKNYYNNLRKLASLYEKN